MRERMPFAVVGSNTTLTDPETGLRYRGREYPWGCVNIEDKVRENIVNYANQVIDGTTCRCVVVGVFSQRVAKSVLLEVYNEAMA